MQKGAIADTVLRCDGSQMRRTELVDGNHTISRHCVYEKVWFRSWFLACCNHRFDRANVFVPMGHRATSIPGVCISTHKIRLLPALCVTFYYSPAQTFPVNLNCLSKSRFNSPNSC